ncbi:MAG: hypothetical protein KKG69_17955 [Alphaproteobacteria bacterium]|nr:hypothetical protein [Alphaproteobacteria bacterium]
MALFLLWWCFDDHLAAALETPGLGHLPWWVVLLIGLCSTTVRYGDRS